MNRTQYNQTRQRIISANRSARMCGKPSQTVPPPLKPVYGFELTDNEGTYAGFTLCGDEAKDTCQRHNGMTMKKRIALNVGHLKVS